MYAWMMRHVFSHIDAETTHDIGLAVLRLALRWRWLRRLVRTRLAPYNARLDTSAFGRCFDSPLCLAAGCDKNATCYEQLYALGFAAVEVGTVTVLPNAGNPRPRITRDIESRSLTNTCGLPSEGSAVVATRLASKRDSVVGVNIAPHDGSVSCQYPVWSLSRGADYVVVNASCPNAAQLRVISLRAVLEYTRAIVGTGPLLVKVSPDMSSKRIDAIANMALDLGVDGIVACNTTMRHDGAGGLSGPALKARTLQAVRRLYKRCGHRVTIVACGGVESGQDVLDYLQAGATLVQAYTSFVYGGPMWPSRVRRELAELLEQHGYGNVSEAVGDEA